MGKEQNAEFYSGNNYMEKHWYKKFSYLYKEMADMLPLDAEKLGIIELGCGVGFFAKELLDRGYSGEYIGIDFSESMIARAKITAPNLNFVVGNLLHEDIHRLYKKGGVYVCMEALEHITDDLGTIKAIPSDSIVLFSVPDYDSKAHVRYFGSLEDVVSQYRSLLTISGTKTIPTNNKRNIFMISAVRTEAGV